MSGVPIDPGVPAGLRLLGDGQLDHCENVAWDARSGTAILGGEGGQIYSVDLDGAVETIAHVPGAFILGIALDHDGTIVACDTRQGRILRIQRDGSFTSFGPPLAAPNYPAFAADGNLYVTLEGRHRGGDGGIVVLDPSGSMRPVPLPRGLDFGNAMVVEGEDLLVVESDGPSVSRVDRGGGVPERLIELAGTVPDGLALDTEGGLWISCYQPNRIYRLRPDGTLEQVADDLLGWHLPMPTGIAFGGADMRTLLIACLGGWSLAALPVEVEGRPPEWMSLRAEGEA